MDSKTKGATNLEWRHTGRPCQTWELLKRKHHEAALPRNNLRQSPRLPKQRQASNSSDVQYGWGTCSRVEATIGLVGAWVPVGSAPMPLRSRFTHHDRRTANGDLVAINAVIYRAAGFSLSAAAEWNSDHHKFAPELAGLSLGSLLLLLRFLRSSNVRIPQRRTTVPGPHRPERRNSGWPQGW